MIEDQNKPNADLDANDVKDLYARMPDEPIPSVLEEAIFSAAQKGVRSSVLSPPLTAKDGLGVEPLSNARKVQATTEEPRISRSADKAKNRNRFYYFLAPLAASLFIGVFALQIYFNNDEFAPSLGDLPGVEAFSSSDEYAVGANNGGVSKPSVDGVRGFSDAQSQLLPSSDEQADYAAVRGELAAEAMPSARSALRQSNEAKPFENRIISSNKAFGVTESQFGKKAKKAKAESEELQEHWPVRKYSTVPTFQQSKETWAEQIAQLINLGYFEEAEGEIEKYRKVHNEVPVLPTVGTPTP